MEFLMLKVSIGTYIGLYTLSFVVFVYACILFVMVQFCKIYNYLYCLISTNSKHVCDKLEKNKTYTRIYNMCLSIVEKYSIIQLYNY